MKQIQIFFGISFFCLFAYAGLGQEKYFAKTQEVLEDSSSKTKSFSTQQERAPFLIQENQATSQGVLKKKSQERKALIQKYSKYVVRVVVDRRRERPQSGQGNGLGIPLPFDLGGGNQGDPAFFDLRLGPYSGVIVGEEGEILVSDTILGKWAGKERQGINSSVRALFVTLENGRTFEAKVLGRNQGLDLALLKIPADNLEALRFSSEKPPHFEEKRFRATPLSIVTKSMNPLRAGASHGVVSAGYRAQGKAFQLDADLGGSDLGGLIIEQGQGLVVGMVGMLDVRTMGQASGVAYGIYGDVCLEALAGLRRGDFMVKPPAPYLGIEVRPADSGTGGLEVQSVAPGSQAALANLQKGDLIEKADSQKLYEVEDLKQIVEMKEVGDQIDFEISREEEKIQLRVTLGSRDE